MRFDVVIGNPPYNKGMDLDFVDMGFNLCNKYCAMIIPAKWQTSDDNQRRASSITYGEFREKLVPHMKHVVFYPCCKDVFDILQVDGITYFILDKQKTFEKCTVENRCKHIEEFIGTETRDIRNRKSLLNIGNEVVNYLGKYKSFTFKKYIAGKYCVVYNTKAPGGNLSTVINKRKTLFIGEGDVERYELAILALSTAKKIIFRSDIIEECYSFKSWMDTRFTRFFSGINASKLTGLLTDDCFRFVPAPPPTASGNPWNHIYTDTELYNYFELPQKYIDIIEAVVKERK